MNTSEIVSKARVLNDKEIYEAYKQIISSEDVAKMQVATGYMEINVSESAYRIRIAKAVYQSGGMGNAAIFGEICNINHRER